MPDSPSSIATPAVNRAFVESQGIIRKVGTKKKYMQQPKKPQPKMVAGEMTGKLYKKSEMDAWKKGATEAMNKQYFNRPENLKYGKGLKKPKSK